MKKIKKKANKIGNISCFVVPETNAVVPNIIELEKQ